MGAEENKEPLEKQIEEIIKKKSDENLALKNLIEKLKEAEDEKRRRDSKKS